MHFFNIFRLATLLVSTAWFLSSPDFEPALAIIGALSVIVVPRVLSSIKVSNTSDDCSISAVVANSNPGMQQTHAQMIGFRLRYIRHTILQMSLRDMAEFLGLDSISLVEGYENGKPEIQISQLKKIEEFFSIRPNFMEAGEEPIFQTFYLSQESVSRYLANGYRPIIVCCPDQRHDLFCHQVFTRTKNDYTQLAIADRLGSFASSGGGKINIGYLINALLDAKKSDWDILIVKATKQEWQDIEDSRYYNKHPFNRHGNADRECAQIFREWFDEYSCSRDEWNRMA